MGGQACVFYGAAEFSRDTDIAVLAVRENLDRLAAAVRDLQAEVIAVPPFECSTLIVVTRSTSVAGTRRPTGCDST